MCQLLQLVQILHRSLSLGDPRENIQHSARTDAARRAFATGLIHRKLQEKLRDVDHTGVFVHDDHAARTHHRAKLAQGFIVDRRIQMLCRNAAARRSAGLRSLERLAVRNPPADIVDYFPHGRTHRDLNQTGIVDFAAERENLCAGGLLRTDAAEPVRALKQNLRHIGEGLNIVENRRLAKQPAHRR